MTGIPEYGIGPHGRIFHADAREQFAARLFDELWTRYRKRVSYVQTYETVIAQHNASFVNDHIAFRSFALQQPQAGIVSLSRIFEALGYQAEGCYQFPQKQLSALHYQHPNPEFPKLFLSELRLWELTENTQAIIAALCHTHRPALSLETLSQVSQLKDNPAGSSLDESLLECVLDEFQTLPWGLPEKADLEAVNAESQYAAWVMVHGYNVNHFTSLINSHGTEALDDIEKTIAALQAAGVPMKAEIEGEHGSILRQSATAAVEIHVPILDQGTETTTPWSYAYFELAERGEILNPSTNKPERFEGFLGAQATHLFEMTRRPNI